MFIKETKTWISQRIRLWLYFPFHRSSNHLSTDCPAALNKQPSLEKYTDRRHQLWGCRWILRNMTNPPFVNIFSKLIISPNYTKYSAPMTCSKIIFSEDGILFREDDHSCCPTFLYPCWPDYIVLCYTLTLYHEDVRWSMRGDTAAISDGVGLSPGRGMESCLGLLLICKVRPLRRSHILADTPSDSSAAKYAAASSSIKRPRHSLSGLPSLSPYWASPFLQPWRALCSTFQWLFRLLKQTDCQPLRYLVYSPSI